ncbi:Secretory lipase [Williamsia sterculiae]|uniref:Secretory lipase n=1 Tax=Williamsia sterculiae TaxID=1344003 RepID=A0A1N7DHF6_9NOCA|nr:Secretory lipase [Williamsia sterculiae]
MLVLGLGPAAQATAAPDDPLPLPVVQGIDKAIPPAPIPHLATIPPRAYNAGFDQATLETRAALLPAYTGDRFFDQWPSGLDTKKPGQLLEKRDVTPVGRLLSIVPTAKVTQIKFRTTDSHDAPSFGTATIITPANVWKGPGARPILVNDIPIVSLGAQCSPGYSFAHGYSTKTSTFNFIPPDTINALLNGYEVILPDHEGPRMAYGEPTVAGRITLDSLRAMGQVEPKDFAKRRTALTGYSGGAIAVHGTVKEIDSYAPELKPQLVGAALGGVPADFHMLVNSMNGNLAAGIFLAAELGIAREHPEMLTIMNNAGKWLSTSPVKDFCGVQAGRIAIPVPTQVFSSDPDPYHSPVADMVYKETGLKNIKAGTPLFIYQGVNEWWIPVQGAINLHVEQCRLGANSSFTLVPGEHAIGALTGYPAQWNWLERRLNGIPAPNGCA